VQLHQFYTEREAQFALQLKIINRNISVISNLRLVVALMLVVNIYFIFQSNTAWYFFPVLLIAFVWLIQRHAKLFDQQQKLEAYVRLMRDEIKALDGDFAALPTGTPFIDPRHPYTHDLDIFGEGSLFQYINRSQRDGGQWKLAVMLEGQLPTAAQVQKIQEAVKELSSKTDFRQEIHVLGGLVEEGKDDLSQLRIWGLKKPFLFRKSFWRTILTALPLVTILLLLLALFVDGLRVWIVLAGLMQWSLLGTQLKMVNELHAYVSRKKQIMMQYARVLEVMSQTKFQSALLQELSRDAHVAHDALRRFASPSGALDARLNIMTNLVVNSVLSYDLNCIYRLEAWKEKHAAHFERWIDDIHQMQALCSLGTFAFNHPDFVFPTINASGQLSGKAVGHPLIFPKATRVTNPIDINRTNSVMVITGANMAGKSTYLRTIGVNVVLALAGAPVCAGEFDCPLIQLRTGMRTADSLKDHQSYFYAELNRLKSIVDELRRNVPLLILLDEILKGTNSTDKQSGSIALVRQLLDHPCLALVATHDVVLGELEATTGGRVTNYCFEADMSGDSLSFNYKLRNGVATRMNATFLMKKMGIIPG